MKKYMQPLANLLSICKGQLLSSSITEQKKEYLQHSITKLELMKSILEGNPFTVPENSSKLEVLLKIEQQLNTLVQQFSNQNKLFIPCLILFPKFCIGLFII